MTKKNKGKKKISTTASPYEPPNKSSKTIRNSNPSTSTTSNTQVLPPRSKKLQDIHDKYSSAEFLKNFQQKFANEIAKAKRTHQSNLNVQAPYFQPSASTFSQNWDDQV